MQKVIEPMATYLCRSDDWSRSDGWDTGNFHRGQLSTVNKIIVIVAKQTGVLAMITVRVETYVTWSKSWHNDSEVFELK